MDWRCVYKMEWVILLFVVPILFIMAHELSKQQKQQNKDKEYILNSQYVDGSLKIFDTNVDMGLIIEPEYTGLISKSYNIKLSYDKLLDYNIKTTEEISEHITLTRVLTLGIFALGAKKKKKTIERFIVLEFLDGDNKKQTAILKSFHYGITLNAMKKLHEYKTQYDNNSKININKEMKVDA